MEQADASPVPARARGGAVRRTLRNAGWLLSGKGVGGVFSLIYLGLAARGLGLDDFGEFALVLTFGQAVASIAQFQTAELVIRYGTAHLAAARLDRFSEILGFAAILDALSALGCVALSAACALLMGGFVGLSEEEARTAALFGASFLVSLRGAPLGVLRVLDRFDIAALSETALPASRLVAAVLCYLAAPSVEGFLIAWALAEFVTTIAVWSAAMIVLRRAQPGARVARPSLAAVAANNEGVWRFAWFTNFASAVSFLWQHVGTLAVGWGAGPADAGAYRVAMQLAQSLSKPVVSLSRAAFPELAEAALRDGGKATARLVSKLSLLAGALGLTAIVLVAVAGEWLLTLVVGPEFAFARNLLVLLTIAAAIEFWGFAQEPAMLALGRPGAVLAARAAVGVLYLGLLVGLLLGYGAAGAAVATIIGRLVYRIAMTTMLAREKRLQSAATRRPI
ncbi:MAG: oligosaccharide flippase family protein [Parvularculaceae bacterium]|nr:oligosaccharide flippase family protein [Parvularculaceae bacterium]